MGAINYGNSDVLINLGYNISNKYKTIEELKSNRLECYPEKYADNVTSLEDDSLEEYYELESDDFDTVKKLIDSYKFQYYDITIEIGYYEGFYIKIDHKWLYFDSYLERLKMQKELTKMKKLLIELINEYRLVAYNPGWCTSWYNIEDTLNMLNDAIIDERLNIKTKPTASQYFERKDYLYGR